MSIVASVKVYDGIVLGAESMTQVLGQVAQSPGQQQFLKAYPNARKLFQIGNLKIGILTYGAGNIGNRSIESLISEFGESVPSEQPVDAVAQSLITFISGHYNKQFGQVLQPFKPVLGFYLAGYSPGSHTGSESEFVLPLNTAPIKPRQDHEFGASWRGISLPFSRLFFGYDPRLTGILQAQGLDQSVIGKVVQAFEQLRAPIIFDGMPVQDAIGFCRFILETTINECTYEIGVASCGGPLHLAAITRSGFTWIARPQLQVKQNQEA